MRPSHLIPLGGVTFLCFLVSAVACGQNPPAPPKPAELPLTRVVLFNSGVGYFHRTGTVDGTARVELKVPAEDVNDLIKSLIAVDRDGGSARSVAYDNPAPADVTLKAFGVDLSGSPTVAQLLHQLRGEKVEITDDLGAKVSGSIVSVQQLTAQVVTPPPLPGDPDEGRRVTVVPPPAGAVEQVNLVTDDGLQSVALAKVKKVKFVKPEVQADFRKALEAVAAARGEGKKAVAVTFAGNGRRRVGVGYVTEAPLWKPSYRVALDAKTARLQGWAAVENTTEEDWTEVAVSLVSGRPMSFKMDLYEPLFVPRPVVELEVYASLRPPMYQGAVTAGGMQGLPANNLGVGGGAFGQLGGGFGIQGGGFGNLGGGYRGLYAGGSGAPSVRSMMGNRLAYDEYRGRLGQKPPGESAGPGGSAGLPNTSSAQNLGEAFEYKVADPVSLPRLKSALLPIANEPVEATRISLYNPKVLERHPLLGLRLANKTKLFLAQGPLTVYDGDTYAGDARLPDVKPGETRLVSYAIDLSVDVKTDHPHVPPVTTAAVVRDGRLVETTRDRAEAVYTVHNRAADERTVWVTQEARDGWNLTAPDKLAERTANLYRFEAVVKPGATATVKAVEERTSPITRPLDSLSDAALDAAAAQPVASPAVRTVLARVKADRAKKLATAAAVAAEEAALKATVEEQGRIRLNIERVPKESEAFKRYLKKFDEQETEIEGRQAKIKELKAEAVRLDKAFAEFVATAKAE